MHLFVAWGEHKNACMQRTLVASGGVGKLFGHLLPVLYSPAWFCTHCAENT